MRSRNVERAPDFDPEKETKEPWQIDYVVMSHPDADHYGGFKYLFNNPKLKFDKVYHNGIVERPFAKPPVKVAGVKYPHDLGGVFKDRGETYLYDYVTSGTALKKLLKIEPKSTKKLVTCFRALYANNKTASVGALGVNIVSLGTDTFMESFDPSEKLSMQILGPIRERPKFKGKTRLSVRTLGGEGETKNGHSIIFKARYNNLTLLLGGDLNSPAQNFLLQQYSGSKETPEKLLKTIHNLENKKQPLGAKDQTKLDKARINFENLEKAGRDIFEVDVAKACHHGSQHIIDSFIRSVNAVATVISSGDDEPHSHPRPSALGAYGKHGRGNRPLLFSTELARSTNEFTPQLKQYLAMRGIVLQIEAEPDEKKKKALEATLEGRKDRNVAVYGMITLRALGDTVIIAQKLERAAKKYRKWDIYELYYDKTIGKFVYDSH